MYLRSFRSHVKHRETHYVSHTVWLKEEGWQKTMPIDLRSNSSFDSFTNRRHKAVSRGRAQVNWGLRTMVSDREGRERGWREDGGGLERMRHCVVMSASSPAIRVLLLRILANQLTNTGPIAERVPHSYTGHWHAYPVLPFIHSLVYYYCLSYARRGPHCPSSGCPTDYQELRRKRRKNDEVWWPFNIPSMARWTYFFNVFLFMTKFL